MKRAVPAIIEQGTSIKEVKERKLVIESIVKDMEAKTNFLKTMIITINIIKILRSPISLG